MVDCRGSICPSLILLLFFILIRVSHASFDLEKALTNTCAGCYQGVCITSGTQQGQCQCLKGWKGPQCDHCFGRILLSDNSTYIIDGPVNYASKSRCTWIVENRQTTKRPVTLKVHNFTTECGWDFMYIHDGSGIYGEQLAAFCGQKDAFEMAAPSGSALLYFVSDLAEHREGFNISFEFNKCPYDCHGNGDCADSCICKLGYTGSSCETQLCYGENQGETGPCLNGGTCSGDQCQCNSHFHGDRCQTLAEYAAWDLMPTEQPMSGRAAHASVLIDDVIWTVGGEHFSGVTQDMIVTFNLTSKSWTPIRVDGSGPDNRYDHTLVKYKQTLYMFGGVINGTNITSELWSFDLLKREWTLEQSEDTDLLDAPDAVSGHTAHVIGNQMYVFFGYNPQLGFYHKIQIYDFIEKTWRYDDTQDHVHGRYGHSSIVVGEKPTRALIYGGTSHNANVTDSLMEYDFDKKSWKFLPPSGVALMLHSATLINYMMIVTGGNEVNTTTGSKQADCFNRKVLAYDIVCDSWYRLVEHDSFLGRYGHSAVAQEAAGDDTDSHIYVIGGFDGRMLNDVYRFTPVRCSSQAKLASCQKIVEGVRCFFADKTCQKYDGQRTVKEDFQQIIKNEARAGGIQCPGNTNRLSLSMCEEQTNCVTCASQSGCGWCPGGHQCLPSDQECIDGQGMVINYGKCEEKRAASPRPCSMSKDCYSCKLNTRCNWFYVEGKATCITLDEERFLLDEQRTREADRLTSSLAPARPTLAPLTLPIGTNTSFCPLPCAEIAECTKCITNSNCMWCPSMKRCIATDAYTVSFAYGQCKGWVGAQTGIASDVCQAESDDCEDHKTCGDCQVKPGCGWVDDNSHTGLGQCVKGNLAGPLEQTLEDMSQWYFTSCPACQCNGHARCENMTTFGDQVILKCMECDNHTTGEHCRYCAQGFYGDARNGGVCQPCSCNGQAYNCHNGTGQCFCTTKGVIGDHCEKCDQKYIGDPKSGKPCYYELAVDFIFTFKLNDERDKYVNELFLYSTPYKKDTDVSFQISCEGKNAVVSLNIKSNTNYGFDGAISGNSKLMMLSTVCDAKGLRRVYLADDPAYPFGTDANTTFYVTVSNITTPITIQVSFAQSPPINWVLFFVIFAACFIVLLVVAGLLWMIKLRIEVYRRNQNRINEIEHMASRPFSSVRLELTNPYSNLVATPISIEPCSNYKAGVYTLAVRLPTGGRQTTPNGTSGMAVASALCLLTQSQLAVLTAPENNDNRNNRKKTLRNYIPFLRSTAA